MGPEDQHPWDAQDEEIRQAFAAKDAEIERLKEIGHRKNEECFSKGIKIAKLEKLIIELCDALSWYEPETDNGLIQRAQETTDAPRR